MNIYIRRNAKRETYTIGALEIAGQKVCDTLEDTDRNLTDRQPEHVIAKLKVAGQTAIPTGTYRVDIDTVSPDLAAWLFISKFAVANYRALWV